MMLRHLIAEQVLLEGEFAPAHLEVLEGEIVRIHRLSPGEGRRRAEIVKASDIGADTGMTVVSPRHQVLPGNVDTHVHINEPGRTSWEGFETGTMAAALGGVTSVVDMPLNSIPPTVDVASLRIKQQAAAGQIFVDVGFWGGIVPGNTAQLRSLWEAGVFGFKCFLLPSGVDEFPPVNGVQLREAMKEVASFDGLVIVHAEDAGTIERATDLTGRRRRLSHYAEWAQTRPHDAEVAAVSDLIEAVRETGCRTHILHLASARALDIIADARAEGLPLTAETCPHYLCFDADAIPDGAAEFKCCPPIRDRGNREALWDGLREGIIDAVVTDHSPSTAAEKRRGAPDLQQAWGGISGLQVGFSAVAHEARLRGIGIETVSAWMATNTALLAGLRRKGSIAAGKDADLVIYDPGQTNMVSAAGLAHKNPISAYDHYEMTGAVVGAVLRGTALYTDQDTTTALAPVGEFLQGLGSPELSALRALRRDG